MTHIAFTHTNLFNGKLDSDWQRDVTILVRLTLENPVHVVHRGSVIENPTYEKIQMIEEHHENRFFKTIRSLY